MTGTVTLSLSRNNALQTISWARVAAGETSAPDDSAFTEFAQPESGDTLAAVVSTGGLQNGDKIYIKVISGDRLRTIYYGYTISVGNIARLTSLSIAGEAVARLGTPGNAWNDPALVAAAFDYQSDEPIDGYALTAIAEDGGRVAYAVMTNSAASPAFTNLTGTPNVQLSSGSILYIRVTSANGSVAAVYRINIFMKATADVLYGQPVISKGAVPGEPPTLDPLWSTIDWTFDISRINLAEMTPVFKFLNTVDGHYDQTGYGHTEGKAKAFWDDNGLYVYAEMTYHDYYVDAAAKDAGSVTQRTTVVTESATTPGDADAHMRDSLQIHTNERLQAYTAGNYGVDYRISPAPTMTDATNAQNQVIGVASTNSRVSGNDGSGMTGSVAAFRSGGNYYSWIRKEGAKEVGYSVLAYIPWRAKTSAQANEVFDSATGLVKTSGIIRGPAIGVEFTLNAVTVGGLRDAILTWNAIGGMWYRQVENYGWITLIMGNLTERGIIRGERDTVYTVTFDKNNTDAGSTDANPTTKPVTTIPPQANVGTLPAVPTRTGYEFAGWYTVSTPTGGMQFTETTPITASITVYARWAPPIVTFNRNHTDASGFTEADPASIAVYPPATTVGMLPIPPTRAMTSTAAHNFTGWNTAANGFGDPFDETTPITGNITVYAQWDTIEN